jgi:hypothetical protein
MKFWPAETVHFIEIQRLLTDHWVGKAIEHPLRENDAQ